MTEKEFHKLTRQDLLELLLAQSKEVSKLQARLETAKAAGEQVQADFQRLKDKLDEKDAQIERLKQKLDEKDLTISRQEKQLEELRESGNSSGAEGADFQAALREKEEQILFLKRQLAAQSPSGFGGPIPRETMTKLSELLGSVQRVIEDYLDSDEPEDPVAAFLRGR